MPAHQQVQEIIQRNRFQRELDKNHSTYLGLSDQ